MSSFPDNIRFRKLLRAYPAKAIQFLYEFYYADLLRISVRLTGNVEASEDILQETMVLVWRRSEWLSRQHEKPIIAWLTRVVQNKSISYFKKEASQTAARRYFVTGSFCDSEEARLISEEMHAHVRKLLSEFPRREQECFRFSREEDMTNKQIADRLHISVKAVERSITSARKRLRFHWSLLSGK